MVPAHRRSWQCRSPDGGVIHSRIEPDRLPGLIVMPGFPQYHEGVNSIDAIVELYKKDIDRTLLQASLHRTVEERIGALEEFEQFREELRTAVRTHDAVR
jgi:hypothetical protein